jgi:hypothetical protein
LSILALSYPSGRSSSNSETRPESRSSTETSNNTLRRMRSRLARAFRKQTESNKISENDSAKSNRDVKQQGIPSRQVSSSTDRSYSSSRSGVSDSASIRSRVNVSVNGYRPMVSWDSSQTVYKPGLSNLSWSAKPTKSDKEGIARKWASLQLNENTLEWNNEERELGNTKDPRELGKKLLFAQLDAQIPSRYWVVPDAENVQEIGEMLVGRWIESGRVRRRMVEWEQFTTRSIKARGGENQQT